MTFPPRPSRGTMPRRAGFVLARASAGLAGSTIRNDTNHLELIRDWFGRPL